jgi:hypothetical protein
MTLGLSGVCVDPNNGTVAGGMRDNGSAQMDPGALTWTGRWGGDGGGCVANLGDPVAANRFMLVSAQHGYLLRIDGEGNELGNADLFDPKNDPRQDRTPYVNRIRPSEDLLPRVSSE